MKPRHFSIHVFRSYKSSNLFILFSIQLTFLPTLSTSLEIVTGCPAYSCPKVLCDLKQKDVQNFCDSVKCVGISVENCRDNSIEGKGRTMYEEHLTMCGCCPGCAKYLGVGDDCERYPPDPTPDPTCTGQFCPILMNRCAPGLECPLVGPNEKKCTFKSNYIVEEVQSCPDKRALAFADVLHWTPRCEVDGSYSPKQCKGTRSNGICFCVSKEGKRIFGMEDQAKAANQTCACSRQVHELREAGHIASMHCTSDGNYEALQCDTESGLCYCVDPNTGKTTGAVLPEHQWKSLPCYSLNITNFDPEGEYLRRCESEWAIAKKLSNEAKLHGLTVLSGRRITCDFDGSFAPVQNIDGRTQCVRKNGGLLGSNSDLEGLYDTNCQCVRDELRAGETGTPFLKKCALITGNYDLISPTGQTEPIYFQCVDKDGIFFGNATEARSSCCLFGDLDDPRNCNGQPDQVKQMCYDPNSGDNEGKTYPCYHWPT